MNIYCFSTLSFAKLQFKSVINKVFHKHGVASFTDAWIETEHTHTKDADIQKVASFTDAWIETGINRWNQPYSLSHLLQMRGLKQIGTYNKDEGCLSHLLQMRGLKQAPDYINKEELCRIFYRCVD